jgi:GntR family transcriptional regulator, trigonelline degradation regulator
MDGETSLRVVVPPMLRAQVAERLREAIHTGRFRPGERLVERQLCEMLEVSRTSLREAFRELESEGLLATLPNRGPIVAVITAEQARATYQVRAMLEGLACRLFTRQASPAQMVALAEAVAALEDAHCRGDAAALVVAKAAFYRVLLEGAANPLASSMLKLIHIRVSQLRRMSLADPAREPHMVREYRDLLEALQARDEEAAWQACLRHVENAEAAALAALAAGGTSRKIA